MAMATSIQNQSSALRGSCACGRNRYIIDIPRASRQHAQVLFDNTNANRWHQANPLTAWLRIPLDWYRSSTTAFFPDETPLSIQRTFESSPFTSLALSSSPSPKTRRAFCGYCGTPLSSWNERTRDEAEHINVTLGSLIDDDLGTLEELDLLEGGSDASTDDNDDEEAEQQQLNIPSSSFLQPRKRYDTSEDIRAMVRGAPWFEDLVENSRLGTLRRRKGGHTSKDGSMTIEWEVAEWESGGSGGVEGEEEEEEEEQETDVQGTGKRKFKGDGEVDVSMRNV